MMVKLVLRLGLLEIDIDVGPGREDAWKMVKENFRDKIRRARMNGVDLGMINVLIKLVITTGDCSGLEERRSLSCK